MNENAIIHTFERMRKLTGVSQLSMAYALGNSKSDYYGKIVRGKKPLYLLDFLLISHHLESSPAIIMHASGLECFTPPPARIKFFVSHKLPCAIQHACSS